MALAVVTSCALTSAQGCFRGRGQWRQFEALGSLRRVGRRVPGAREGVVRRRSVDSAPVPLLVGEAVQVARHPRGHFATQGADAVVVMLQGGDLVRTLSMLHVERVATQVRLDEMALDELCGTRLLLL
jgi:hypothetical protein